jgi:hypothetical protein
MRYITMLAIPLAEERSEDASAVDVEGWQGSAPTARKISRL